ncbi:hypothetical protein [Desertivirga brevis]|uniref:hypothetical protein n=1 Tax=Desertivirga brevis TaxID=2810310 RepID=UPI001A964FBC|nr:hypothetical protein [Pedobacter sp. SYSU D00873]
MKGISKKQHEHLTDALLQLEQVFSQIRTANSLQPESIFRIRGIKGEPDRTG